MTEERGEEQSAGAIVACGGRLQWLSGRKLSGETVENSAGSGGRGDGMV